MRIIYTHNGTNRVKIKKVESELRALGVNQYYTSVSIMKKVTLLNNESSYGQFRRPPCFNLLYL